MAPEWLAFYQTKEFKEEAHCINYFARVLDIQKVARRELFPDEPNEKKPKDMYYQLILSPLEHRRPPIPSRRQRRIVFIPTTLDKFATAVEINDLYDESLLEDRLWAMLKLHEISAERQEFLKVESQLYSLDFAIYCRDGNLALETDGDTWHADPKQIPLDNRRDNDLKTAGWVPLRFNTKQIQEELEEYCVPTIQKNINRLGGFSDKSDADTPMNSILPANWQQMTMFDHNPQVKRKPRRRR